MGYVKNIVVIAVALLFAVMASVDFIAMRTPEPIADNPGVTEVRMLSEYCEGLKGTALDTEVYILDSGKPGGTLLVLGGTHPNETASYLAAIAMVENLKCTQGRLFIIPWTNKSGFTHTSPLDGMQDFFNITLADGSVRKFRVGNRLTNPVDQWPDYTYYMGSSGRQLEGTEIAEIRNVDRLYYGNENLQPHQRRGRQSHHGHARGFPGIPLSGLCHGQPEGRQPDGHVDRAGHGPGHAVRRPGHARRVLGREVVRTVAQEPG